MRLIKSNKKKILALTSFFFSSSYFFTGCMTSSRQDQLQESIDQLQVQVSKMQNQLNSKDQQINNTTQTAIASQNETQSLQDQLQLTQGVVDEVRNRLKKLEENLGSAAATTNATSSSNVINISNNTDSISILQRQIARLELISNARLTYNRKGKLPVKIRNADDLSKLLKINFESGNFKAVTDLATSILTAHEATDQMLSLALQYRGEARFQSQDYRGAAIDLATVTELFQNAPRRARALLLIGDSYVYLKNNAIALLYYQDCSKSFATTPEGKAATSRLSNLSSQMNAHSAVPQSQKQ